MENKIDCLSFLRMINGCIDKEFTSIRFIKKQEVNYFTGRTNTNYGYFDIKDGKITGCERGYSKYKGWQLIDIQKCWEENEDRRMRDIFTGMWC